MKRTMKLNKYGKQRVKEMYKKITQVIPTPKGYTIESVELNYKKIKQKHLHEKKGEG